MEEAVYALATYPDRCPMAPEARKLRRELRHLLYGKKPHVYRVIYEVDERRQTVWVLTVRHGARRRLKVATLPERYPRVFGPALEGREPARK